MKQKNIVVVLGMHRSGTSVITRGLQALGVQLGTRLLPAKSDNEKGFWEDMDINALNVELLAALGQNWHTLAPLLPEHLNSTVLDTFRLRAVQLLREKLSGVETFGLKDPRIARLLPFWTDIFAHLDIQVSYMIACRHPMSVARSLAKRDGFALEKAYQLWLEYMLASLVGTQNHPRLVVDYDLLMAEPAIQLQRIAQTLNLKFDAKSKAFTEFKEKFLEEGLRHSRFAMDDLRLDKAASPQVMDLYLLLQAMASDQLAADATELDVKLTGVAEVFRQTYPLLQYLDRTESSIADRQIVWESKIARLNEALAERDTQIHGLNGAAAERNELIAGLNEALAERDTRIHDLNGAVAGRDELIAGLNEALAERDTRIHGLNGVAAERDELIAGLNEALAERDTRIHDLNGAVAGRDELIAGLNEALAEQDTRIHGLNGAVAERDEHIAGLNQAVAERDLQISIRQAAIDALHNSNSWRLCAPLRWAKAQLSRMLGIVTLVPRAIRHGGGVRLTLCKAINLYRREGMAGLHRGVRIVRTGGQPLQPLPALDGPAGTTVTVDRNDYAEWVRRYDTLDDEVRARICGEMEQWHRKPLISVVMPVYNPPLDLLRQAADSIRQQLYPEWELCIADDASSDPQVCDYLRVLEKTDDRIKVVYRKENGHISRATNSALDIATGEYIALMDNDDLLPEHALYWVARTVLENPDAALIYSDEDKIDIEGRRSAPYFKPDWNQYLFRSHNMISHLGVYRRDLIDEVGRFRGGFEGSQDYDLALRCTERLDASQIIHIPKVLYHWRIHSGSTAMAGDEKPYAALAGLRALDEHLQRMGIAGKTELLPIGMYRTHYDLPAKCPLVSLIIPTRNAYGLVKQCIDSIRTLTTYPTYEIILIDNGSDDPQALEYFAEIARQPNIRVIRDDSPFNYSALNNAAVRQARGELIGLINNDIEVITPEWLDEMVSIALQPNVGAVGARLWYPDDRLQHGGVIVGVLGVAGHAHKFLGKGDHGYFGRAVLTQELSAVTAACLIIRKTIFEQVQGLDEVNLKVAFNDVDFCLRVQEAGYVNVWTPYAELYHHESATRGFEDTPAKQKRFIEEVQYMHSRWPDLRNDYAYNPNLTLEHDDFSLAWPPREKKTTGSLNVQIAG